MIALCVLLAKPSERLLAWLSHTVSVSTLISCLLVLTDSRLKLRNILKGKTMEKRTLTLQGSQPVKRCFMFMRSFAEMHYKLGEISLKTYTTIIDLLDREEERMTLESEE